MEMNTWKKHRSCIENETCLVYSVHLYWKSLRVFKTILQMNSVRQLENRWSYFDQALHCRPFFRLTCFMLFLMEYKMQITTKLKFRENRGASVPQLLRSFNWPVSAWSPVELHLKRCVRGGFTTGNLPFLPVITSVHFMSIWWKASRKLFVLGQNQDNHQDIF